MNHATRHRTALRLLVAAGVLGLAAMSAAATKPARPGKAARAPSARAAVASTPQASPEQLQAAERVYYGHYECEQARTVDVAADPKHAGYVDVKNGKASYLMKPVLSSTGALRLEDVKGRTLMVQIATKSMLLDVMQGHRLLDDCESPRQRALMEQAQAARALDAAASAPQAAASVSATPAPSGLGIAPVETTPASAAGPAAMPASTASAPTATPGSTPTPASALVTPAAMPASAVAEPDGAGAGSAGVRGSGPP